MTSSPEPAASSPRGSARIGRRDLFAVGRRAPAASGPAHDPDQWAGRGSPSAAAGLGSTGPGMPDTGAGADHWVRVSRRAMACRFEITLSGEDAHHVPLAHDALQEADRLEAALTVFRETSELMRINRQAGDGPVATDAELFDLLAHCRALSTLTGGAFDVTSTPLSRCWGFLAREGRVPSAEAIERARAAVGMTAVSLDPARRTVHLTRPSMSLNLGSIGKGYAVERIAAWLGARGVRHALVSAGGSSVVALGGRGNGWAIDLRSRQLDGRLARLYLRHGALATSGAGEQFVEVDGRRYGHVLDPRTGWPAASGLLSASVVAADGATADALATAFLVGGRDLARSYCAAHSHVLAVITPEETQRPELFGAYAGAVVEDL